jgi:two-component system, chemotaxis family, protein-glutamate methylesterase/glutaminase
VLPVKRYGILIVDDSAFMRRAIGLLLEKDPSFYIVGVARNGIEALEKVKRFKPDAVTMDVEMPEMDGIAALEEMMRSEPLPVVMLSSQTGEGAEATLKALALGAVDFFLKSDLISDTVDSQLVSDFHIRMKNAAEARLPGASDRAELLTPSSDQGQGQGRREGEIEEGKPALIDLLVIGCSTGGPSALQTILPRFLSHFPAGIIVVQHMPPGFTKPLADRFDQLCPLKVKEAEQGDVVEAGTIYIAPAGHQTVLRQGRPGQTVIDIVTENELLYRPSVNPTLTSASMIYKERLLTAILTGMGNDGLEGCRVVKQNGGHVLTEAEESCIVYGMPRAVYEAGLSDRQAHLSNMFRLIQSFV